jgi:SAM-dependent methyltransferase
VTTRAAPDPCVICAGDLGFLGFRRGEPRSETSPRYTYYVCRRCGTIQLSPMPTQEALAVLNEHSYLSGNEMERSMTPEAWERASRTYNASMLETVRAHGVRGPLLDFGAGYGFLCELLNKNGYACTGVELSEERLVYCRATNKPVQKGSTEVFQQRRGAVAAVLLCAVFEHLSAHQAFLEQAKEALQEDGVIISLHPTSKTFRLLAFLFRFGMSGRELPSLAGAFAPPWHTLFISVGGMRQLAERAGLEVCDVRPAPQGRLDGGLGVIQASLEAVNRVGWSVVGAHWPLHTSHIFVLKRKGAPAARRS